MDSSTDPISEQFRSGPPQHQAPPVPDMMQSMTHPRPPLTPSTGAPPDMNPNQSHPLLPSAPASPPTPAPSPTPHSRTRSWHSSGKAGSSVVDLGSEGQRRDQNMHIEDGEHEEEDDDENEEILKDFRYEFSKLSSGRKKEWLHAIVDMCDSNLLSHLQRLVSPRLKKDPFVVLPNELCFRILEFVDDPRTFVRASQVSRRWREVLSDDQAWKTLCEKHSYRRMSNDVPDSLGSPGIGSGAVLGPAAISTAPASIVAGTGSSTSLDMLNQNSHYAQSASQSSSAVAAAAPDKTLDSTFLTAANQIRNMRRTQRPRSTHRSHFKHRYLVDYAWRKGGRLTTKHISPDHGVVTSLHLTKKYIVVALDNAKIHVFDTRGTQLRVLQGHVMGVWAMVPWGDLLVSGGCDRDVRVWNMANGQNIHTMRGHTSTVRCLKMSDSTTAISGSRDTTLRIWDIPSGQCRAVLLGHQASVRCLEIHGDLVVSGSYDTTAKIWKISTGECLRTLQGHFSQIYAVAFDGTRIATGSLDTSVRIWDPSDGSCKAILQGHTSLVGQLQLRDNQLVTGGSDGSVRVWSLQTYTPIHRLAAHDNSVTSLQFDDSRIVSGGSDGRVKIWDLRSGTLIRELIQPAEAVWRVAFEDERSVVLASRHGRTVMELWDFAPPEEDDRTSAGAMKTRPQLQPAAPVAQRASVTAASSNLSAASSAAISDDAILMDDIQQLTAEMGVEIADGEALTRSGVAGGDSQENVDMVDAYVDVMYDRPRSDSSRRRNGPRPGDGRAAPSTIADAVSADSAFDTAG